MRMSDLVTQQILAMLEQSSDSIAEIRRNELAEQLGCVPSQINYVLTSRFTPEQGYIVESRRGGGGYVRITRVKVDRTTALMHIINSIGNELDRTTARAILMNLAEQGIVDTRSAALIDAALSEKSHASVPHALRAQLRAAVMKNMLLTLI